VTGDQRKVGSATGFVHRRESRDFLITNWHVETSRKPENPGELLDGYPESPTCFEMYVPKTEEPNRFLPSDFFELYENGRPRWIETKLEGPAAGKRTDLVAIPIEFPDGPLIVRIEEFAKYENQRLRIGRDVVIVGYPFGIRAENPFPTWKRGSIASEPSILIGGLPKYYIDTPGRPGMSGSPVFMIDKGTGVSGKTYGLLTAAINGGSAIDAVRAMDVDEMMNAPEVNMLQFAGVYSGSVGDKALNQLNVGVAWHAGIIDTLFMKPVIGSNPFPPQFARSR